MHDLSRLLIDAPPDNMRPRWNGAPTQDFAVCRLAPDGARHISRLRWGLIPSWAKDLEIGARLINARAETVHEKPVESFTILTTRPTRRWRPSTPANPPSSPPGASTTGSIPTPRPRPS